MQELRDRVAVVTGAASGIGRALAHAFVREGSRVALADVEEPALARAVSELERQGAAVLGVPTDVADAASVERLAKRTLAHFGRVDVVCNNAGISTFNPIHEQTLDDWRWVLDVNLWGVIHGVHFFLPILLEQRSEGHIVNTASIAGVLSGVAYLGPYAATKVAVVSISETLRVELAQLGAPIGVSVLCPSGTNTAVIEAERNRPRGSERRTAEAEAFRMAVKRGFTEPAGLEPEVVAERTLAAVREGRFWVFPHPEMRPVLEARLREILEAYPGPAK